MNEVYENSTIQLLYILSCLCFDAMKIDLLERMMFKGISGFHYQHNWLYTIPVNEFVNKNINSKAIALFLFI